MRELKLPFSIDRTSSLTLVRQVVGGIQQAIVAGRFRKGDVLPSRKEMADALGVSQRITREALAELTGEGWLEPRQGLGSIVLGTGAKVWRGRVLVVGSAKAEGSYYFSTVLGELRRRLVLSDYLFSYCSVLGNGRSKSDFAALDAELRQPTDLIVTFFTSPATLAHVARTKVPVVSIGMRVPPRSPCVGHVVIDFDGAVPDFVRRCQDNGVRRVLRVGFGADVVCVKDALADVGIEVVDKILPKPSDVAPLEDAVRLAIDRFRTLDVSREDVLLFTDDYLASGALLSLTSRGVRIPEDVRVVTLSNKGSGPVYLKSLSRMEFDPREHAAALFDYLRRELLRQEPPSVFKISPRYVDGASFPVG